MSEVSMSKYEIEVIDEGPIKNLKKLKKVQVTCNRCGATLNIPGELAVEVYKAGAGWYPYDTGPIDEVSPRCPVCGSEIIYNSTIIPLTSYPNPFKYIEIN